MITHHDARDVRHKEINPESNPELLIDSLSNPVFLFTVRRTVPYIQFIQLIRNSYYYDSNYSGGFDIQTDTTLVYTCRIRMLVSACIHTYLVFVCLVSTFEFRFMSSVVL
jgi:hypothetical protein